MLYDFPSATWLMGAIMKSLTVRATFPFLVLASLQILGCSNSAPTRGPVQTPDVTGPVIDSGSIPMGTGRAVKLSNDKDIYVQNRGGKLVFQVEGAISPQAFAQITASALHKPPGERADFYQQKMDQVVSGLTQVHGIELYEAAEVGYFAFEMPYEPDLMGSLRKLELDYAVWVEPSEYNPGAVEEVRKLNPMAEGVDPEALLPARGNSKQGTAGFSGLERMKVPEFVKMAEADIGDGTPVNGSSVLVGVTDTGVTLNHPAFFSHTAPGVSKNRITYMKDFTREGRVYFHPKAKFEVQVPIGSPPDVLFLNAEVIPTPKLPDVPVGDKFLEMKNLTIKVSPELRDILLKPGSGAKLGILDEAVISSSVEPVDLNGDGKTDSKIPIILIPGAHSSDDLLYVDLSGSLDFRSVKPIGDWNKTKNTLTVMAEEVGFDLRNDLLPSNDGENKVPVRAASIVGFDPGNHGTHVSGIIAAGKLIENDDPNTLARGVAPEAQLAVNRVCANNGGCNAMAAFVDLAARGADVINMSLGGLNGRNDGFGMQEMMINRLSAIKNILFIISAGNSGPGRQTIGSPSVSSLALSVGASATRSMIQRQYQWPGHLSLQGNRSEERTDSESSLKSVSKFDEEDFLLFFSSRGPTAAGGFKPNITAPGTELSAIQLNSAPGFHGGLDVYWGTSMAAPAATGAYALFLDAIRKYNEKHPLTPLTQNALKLREVLIQSARPFDVSRFDPVTKEKLTGQYTWIDEGTGMIDLPAAWKLLKQVRDKSLPSAVLNAGLSQDLEYEVIVPMTSPSGIAYDGSTSKTPGLPTFGKGIYLSYAGTESFRQVSIGRRLPQAAISSAAAGLLSRQLKTTQDVFVLKTLIYGSDQEWLKPGVLDDISLPTANGAGSCQGLESPKVTVIGEGATIQVNPNGIGGKLAAQALGNINVCLDREMIRNVLEPGDHGALIMAYRMVDGVQDVLPAFTIPVYLTVPHHTLTQATAYDVTQSVTSFNVHRNYVTIPNGTSLVRVSLEVPTLKKSADGLMEKGEFCSGVELMPLVGNNTSKHFKSRLEARVSNCDVNGGYSDDSIKRKVSFTITNPKAGVWDLPVFGSYRFPRSKYRLRVDYLTSVSPLKEIKGTQDVLRGKTNLSLQDSSLDAAVIQPSASKSTFELTSLLSQSSFQVKNGDVFVVPEWTSEKKAVFRSYPAAIKKVTVTTGGSPGNDLDLFIIECSKSVLENPQVAGASGGGAGVGAAGGGSGAGGGQPPSDSSPVAPGLTDLSGAMDLPELRDPSCHPLTQSDGPTDEETVTFSPTSEQVYLVSVVGKSVKNEGKFTVSENLTFASEKGTLNIQPTGQGTFDIEYWMSPDQLASSPILSSELFLNKKYTAEGGLKIRAEDGSVLFAVPVSISSGGRSAQP